jgi:hypothetical protein
MGEMNRMIFSVSSQALLALLSVKASMKVKTLGWLQVMARVRGSRIPTFRINVELFNLK